MKMKGNIGIGITDSTTHLISNAVVTTMLITISTVLVAGTISINITIIIPYAARLDRITS